MLVVNNRIKIPLKELRFTFVRSAGPGGQNVNKVNTKAVMRWSVGTSPAIPQAVRQRFQAKYRRRITKEGEIVISSQRFRDRGRNVADCLAKLRDMLESVATPPRTRKPTRPTAGSVARRRQQKERESRKKQTRRKVKFDEE